MRSFLILEPEVTNPVNRSMPEDIRQKPYLDHKDVVGLNFMRTPGIYHFRRHYRAGLRSHIMEILSPQDLEKERKGVSINGLMQFPRAKPTKVLRIFRTRFESLREAQEEPRKVKIIGSFLAPDHMAWSDEFIVGYKIAGSRDILLCGLQEYVEGEILDPWSYLDREHFEALYWRLGHEKRAGSEESLNWWLERVHQNGITFVSAVRRLIQEAAYVPDLAGVGNLVLTSRGNLKLVDINNVSKVSFTREIPIDDRGYPVCDKSIEALFQIERKILGRADLERDPLYRTFLDPGRMGDVRVLVRDFHMDIPKGISSSGYPYPAPEPGL